MSTTEMHVACHTSVQGSSSPRLDALVRVVREIASFTISNTTPERQDRLWPPSAEVYTTNALSVGYGACGTALFLHRVNGSLSEGARQWLITHPITAERIPPGLYTGLAGIAYTFALLEEHDAAVAAMRHALVSPLIGRELGFFQGDAGVGFAALALHHMTGCGEMLQAASSIGDRTVDTLGHDVRKALAGQSGRYALGLGYGPSGIAMFLAALFAATGDIRFREQALKCIAVDIEAARFDPQAQTLRWGVDSHDIGNRPYWLRGGSGVACAFLRCARWLDAPELMEAARLATNGAYALFSVSPSLFEGLSGIGELHIDMYQGTGEVEFLKRAWEIAETIKCYRIETSEGAAFPSRTLNRVSADLGYGSAGIGVFFDRLLRGGPRLLHDISFSHAGPQETV